MTASLPDAPPLTHADPACRAVGETLARVGDKWTVLLVRALQPGPARFNALKRMVGGISQQMLTRSLRLLERDGMVTRTVRATVPPQVEYALTPLGHSLAVPVMALAEWTLGNMARIEANRAAYDAGAAGGGVSPS